jgi:hypothetical protein
VFLGGGMQLTPSLSTDTGLTLKSERVVADRALEVSYAVG